MRIQKPHLFFLPLIFIASGLLAQPTINSFSPTSGPVGTSVTITGTNFSPTPSNNIVFFGAVKATVTTASATSVTVTVPNGITYQPITVTVNGLTAFSNKAFIITFGGGVVTSDAFHFATNIDNVTGIDTDDMAIADLNEDGKPDIIVVDNTNGFFAYYRNTTTGSTITFAPRVSLQVGGGTHDLSVTDVDGDGKKDVLVTNSNDNNVSIFRNTTSGGSISFAPLINIAAGTNCIGITVTDLDGDGKADIATAGTSLEGTITLIRNTSTIGNISFAPKSDLNTIGVYSEIINTDINNDNKADLVLTNFALNIFSVLRNTSTGGTISFATKVDFATAPYPLELTSGDIDGDGKNDISVSCFNLNFVSTYRNTSAGASITFGARTDHTMNAVDDLANGTDINDLDGDSKPDLTVLNNLESIEFFKNNSVSGSIVLGAVINIPGLGYKKILSCDFNADSKPDLAMISGAARVAVFRNRSTEPQITSFSPTTSGSGTTITITGANFTGVTAVSFGGVPAASFTVVNSTTITAVVASGASGNVVVTAPHGIGSRAGFTFIGIPTVTSFTPTSTTSGATVTITGTNFTGTNAVSFGGVPAASFTVVNSTTITAVVGNGGSGNVVVSNSFGSGSLAGFTFIIPPPLITGFSPSVAGTGTIVQITGSNFLGATAVSFGGVPATSFTILSQGVINAIVGTGASGNVVVTTPNGTGSRPGFFYVPPPSITSFSPTSAPTNTTVTIYGSNFNNVNAVSFGGVPASSFSIQNSTTITAVVANGASGNVSVTTPYGTSTLSGFVYVPPPSITSFSPTSGPPGTLVTITGTNLSSIYSVSFQGVSAASFTIVNATTITAVAGNGNTGPISVSGTNGFFTTSSNFTFNYLPPTITSFTPTSGTTGTSVTITGTNFVAVTSVGFGNGSTFNFTVNSPTSITAVVPNGSSGNVTVTTLGGTATLAGFTFNQPPPTITTFYHVVGSTGTAITITGTNFIGVTAVNFGGVPASSFNVNSNTSITAIVGTGATGQVSVTTPGGTANSGSIFTYYNPVITSFTPTSASTGATVTINGSGFFNLSSVKFGGVAASSFIIVSQNQITAVVGNGASGEVSVTSQNATGALPGFTFTSAVTLIGSVSPSIASSGMTINVTGYGFTGATSVMIGGVPATSFVINSNTSITAVVGAAASGDISVTSPTGTGTFSGFIYSMSPLIASFNPETATIGSSITIKGANFSPVISNNIVYFGGIKASILSASDTSLIVFAPVGATHDRISVTTNGRTGYSTKFFRATFAGIGSLTTSSFATKIDSAVANSPLHISTSDLNLDGKPDIVVSNQASGSNLITIYKNAGSPGTIALDPRTTLANIYGPIHTIAGDLDGDGKLDLISGNGADMVGVTIFRNTSTGSAITFDNQILLNGFALGGFRPAIGDFNGDGKPDLAVASEETYAVHVLRNTSTSGSISFAPFLTFPAGVSPQDISITDMDMDGKPDIVIGAFSNSVDGNDGRLHVLRNTSTGSVISFSPVINLTTGLYTRGLIMGDIDGDGKSDVALVNEIPRTMSIFRNTSVPGTVSFANKIEILTGAGPYSVSIADVDGNSKPDLVLANNHTTTVSVFGNTSTVGAISFSPMVNFTVGSAPSGVTIGDFDMDGKPDIASSNRNSATVSILRNLSNGIFINSFTPQSGTTGTSVTITGLNFTGATAVSFGGVPAQSFTVNSSTSITAIVAAGSSGTITVTTAAGTATIAGFTYVNSAPTITSFTPTSGTTGTSVTITGTNFTAASAVTFGGVAAASFVVNSATSITAIVGAGATGNVSVTTPGGTATATSFTYNAVTGIGGPGSINSKELIVNPNPAKDFLIIKHPSSNKNAELDFYDILGRKVRTFLPARNSRQTDVILNYMTPGIYTIVWSDGTRVLSRIIVIN